VRIQNHNTAVTSLHLLHRLEAGALDEALLPMPIEGPDWVMPQIARDPLVVYMQKDDPLARAAQVSLSDLAERLTVFRDPAVHPATGWRARRHRPGTATRTAT
jgi:DNA-binding transcriptional LysR family regulator